MTSIKELTEIGEKFGFKGEELRKYVTEEQTREREERQNEREIMNEREKRERKVRLLERESESGLAEERHRMAMELAVVQGRVGTGGPGYNTLKGPKLPFFVEDQDTMDSYIYRFERFATVQGWPRDHWSVQLSALLKGKALEVYARLSIEDGSNYEKLKLALLKRFELTEEGFRKRFRSCRPEGGETFVQYFSRAKNYLERWFQLGRVDQTYEGVIDYLLRDQLLSICQRDLYLFLKEKVISSGSQMAESADLFAEARGGCHLVVSQGSSSGPVRGGYPRSNGSGTKCYECGGNHLARDCQRRKEGSGVKRSAAMYPGPGNLSNVFGFPDARESNRFNRVDRGRGRERTRNHYGRGSRGNRFNCIVANQSLERIGLCLEGECPQSPGQVNGKKVVVMRDTGATCVVVRQALVKPEQYTGRKRGCQFIDGTQHWFPVAMIPVKTSYFSGTTEALCMEAPLYDLVIGNIRGARYPDPKALSQAVETRSQSKGKPYRSLHVPEMVLDLTREEFAAQQKSDSTLQATWEKVREGKPRQVKRGGQVNFIEQNGLCYRQFSDTSNLCSKQLIVPKPCRESVMQLAHDSLMAGHLGVRKTTDRVISQFYWPGVLMEIKRFCRSCDVCQRTIPKGKVTKVKLGEMPRIETPFRRVAVDLVGPIEPMTDRKNRYILVMVDYATRYPEAVALPGIEAERVAEALVDMFSRLGVPEEMLTDLGSQFTSGVMKEVSRLLSFRQLTTTPYHPICNGLVEKFNGTLKQMIKRMCGERPKDWDKYLNPMLFAFREVPQESLGFSPFQLLYGRKVRGPMGILKELWSGEGMDAEVKSTYKYVVDLQKRLTETCKLAQDSLDRAKSRQRKYYNLKARTRKLNPGDQVLVLLPVDHNKLLLKWKGPFTVEGTLGNGMDYHVRIGAHVKLFHINMLKQYFNRDQDKELLQAVPTARRTVRDEAMPLVAQGILTVCSAGTVDEPEGLRDEEGARLEQDIQLDCPAGTAGESIDEVSMSAELDPTQVSQVREVLSQFKEVLTDLPGLTHYVTHDIKLTTSEPVRVKGYPVPFHAQETINNEVRKMLDLGVIEPSNAPYSSPIVLIRKKDETVRFCIDFRQLNKVTVFDSEPMPNVEEMFSKLSQYKYFSKIDLSKGYWQVPLSEEAKDMTSFETTKGLFRFKVMPFGLVCAPATFCRLMRKVLDGVTCADSFVDDILVFSETWTQHLSALEQVFERLRQAGLTAKPTKCFIGYRDIECLGHLVGETLKPIQAKVEAIQRAERPRTKKQVRSFLGVVGYYRKFIPNYSAIAGPLTDLTRKGQPNQIKWTDVQERSFNTLKQGLMGPPILKLPNLSETFILRTDSSDLGLGAVLLQEEDDCKLPIAYASRKLLERERNYSVIEKECLAVVWGVAKFHRYLFGKEFVLETDHQPLLYLNKSKMANSRLMRWALALQPYRMRIKAIPGRDNVGADYLSRTDEE